MGIRFSCPNGHKLNVKDHLAGKRGVCPACGAKFVIPAAGQSTSAAGPLPAGAAAAPEQGEMTQRADASASASIVAPISNAPPTSGPAAPAINVKAPPAPEPSAPAPVPGARSAAIVNASTPGPPQITAPPAMPAPSAQAPFAVTEFEPAPAAVAKYAAHRMRSRRLQTTIAIGLLVAVVVLGVILIWVLSSRNDTTSSSQSANRVRSVQVHAVRQND